MKRFLAKNPNRKIIIVVPTDALQRQWLADLAEQQVPKVYEVLIINTVVKHEWDCDLLVLDRWHLSSLNSLNCRKSLRASSTVI